MQSQIEYELDVLKSRNYDHALQFIEHLVNILVRMANALTDNGYVSNRVPQQEDDNFWGYTFNFIAKVVDFELDAMYAVTYRNNQLTLLFNPKEIEDDYTVETMLEGLRHEGYHLLFNHLNVHKNLDNYMSNLAADCEINQHLEKPHKHWISREYIAQLCNMPEHTVKEKAGSLYYYELLNQKMPPNKRKQPKKGNQESDRENGKRIHIHDTATLTINGTIDTDYYEEHRQLLIEVFKQLFDDLADQPYSPYVLFRLNLITMWESEQHAIILDSSRNIVTVPLITNN